MECVVPWPSTRALRGTRRFEYDRDNTNVSHLPLQTMNDSGNMLTSHVIPYNKHEISSSYKSPLHILLLHSHVAYPSRYFGTSNLPCPLSNNLQCGARHLRHPESLRRRQQKTCIFTKVSSLGMNPIVPNEAEDTESCRASIYHQFHLLSPPLPQPPAIEHIFRMDHDSLQVPCFKSPWDEGHMPGPDWDLKASVGRV